MRYLVTGNLAASDLPNGCTVVASGEHAAFEAPWSFGPMLLARVENAADLSSLKGRPGVTAYEVAGVAEPNDGAAFLIGSHVMKDMDGMAPYIAGVPPVIARYDCHYIARGNDVTPLAGPFRPDRVALMQFPDAAQAVSFYTCPDYARLLPIRLRCTEPRMMLMMRVGEIPAALRPELPAASR